MNSRVPASAWRKLLCITLLSVLSHACSGQMEDASAGENKPDSSDVSPPGLDLVRFSDSHHVPREFELAWSNGEICHNESRKPVSPAIQQIIAGRHWRRAGVYNKWDAASRGESIITCDKGDKADDGDMSGGRKPDSALRAIIRKLDQLHAQIPQLRPVTVELFPIFENTGGERVSFATDDAFYDAGRETIVILPSSLPTPRVRLWESPFVLAHELAHHAIVTKFRLQIEDWCEEGNADLMAFRMTGENPELIRELPGFGSDRDPSWPRFSDGENKANTDLRSPAPMHRKGAAFAHIAWLRNQNPISPANCAVTAQQELSLR